MIPVDYYSAPPGDRRPIVGKRVPIGCGVASMVFLVLLVAGGYFAAHGGMQSFVGYAFENTPKDLEPMYAKDVTAAERKQLDDALHEAAARVRSGRVTVESCAPLLRAIQDAVADHKVTRAETETLIRDARGHVR